MCLTPGAQQTRSRCLRREHLAAVLEWIGRAYLHQTTQQSPYSKALTSKAHLSGASQAQVAPRRRSPTRSGAGGFAGGAGGGGAAGPCLDAERAEVQVRAQGSQVPAAVPTARRNLVQGNLHRDTPVGSRAGAGGHISSGFEAEPLERPNVYSGAAWHHRRRGGRHRSAAACLLADQGAQRKTLCARARSSTKKKSLYSASLNTGARTHAVQSQPASVSPGPRRDAPGGQPRD